MKGQESDKQIVISNDRNFQQSLSLYILLLFDDSNFFSVSWMEQMKQKNKIKTKSRLVWQDVKEEIQHEDQKLV